MILYVDVHIHIHIHIHVHVHVFTICGVDLMKIVQQGIEMKEIDFAMIEML
jgi:hypothetical protein